MGTALYRTFRSMSFDELVGQDHITTTLKNSLKNDTISHAYLLTGPRGVGKTSVARILAHAVNNLPYDSDSAHIDIIEIDAASNRRIDEIRELRERVHIAPTAAKYKVYIIDEVHMLTKEAFNALLKTLEEPPAHVIFILATTDFHKLPETIVSRCLRLTFKPITRNAITAHLKTIAEKENFRIDDTALELIAEHGSGSFRDSISLLDQVRNTGEHITINVVEQTLGRASESLVESIIEHLASGSTRELVETLEEAYMQGANEVELAKQVASYIRTGLIEHTPTLSPKASIRLLKELLSVPASVNPKTQLELTLLEASLESVSIPRVASTETKKIAPQPKPEPEITQPTPVSSQPSEDIETAPEETEHKIATPTSEIIMTAEIPEQIDTVDELWTAVLQALKSHNNTLYGVARMANVSQDGDTLILSFQFAFHSRKIGDTKSKATIWDIIKAKNPKISDIKVEHTPKDAPGTTEAPAHNDIYQNINNIFGSTEVLES